MANKDPKNVKRLVEDVSKEVATKAYNGGGGGTQLYQHTLILIESNSNQPTRVGLTIINSSSSEFTLDGVIAYLKNNGFTGHSENTFDAYYPATGVYNGYQNPVSIYGVFMYIDDIYGEEYFYALSNDHTQPVISPNEVIDTVVAL